jgi:hypothetical protein
MPYIKELDRVKFKPILEEFDKIILHSLISTGDMNYLITKMVHNFLDEKGVSYKNINEMIGVLECAKLELYRKIASPYEDEKEKTNGKI